MTVHSLVFVQLVPKKILLLQARQIIHLKTSYKTPPPPVPDDSVRDGNNEEKDNNLSNDAGQLLRNQIKSYENPEQGGVVDLSGKSVNSNITPLLLTTQDEQAKADQWYLEQVQYQGYTFTKGNDIHDNTDKAIETGRDWTVATISLFSAVPVVKSYTYEAIAAGDLVAVGATWINDCYVRTPSNCPPPEAVAFRTAVNLSVDLGGAALGNLIHKVAPINNEIGKEGVENILNFLEFSGNRIDTRNGDLLKNILFPGEKDVNDEHW